MRAGAKMTRRLEPKRPLWLVFAMSAPTRPRVHLVLTHAAALALALVAIAGCDPDAPRRTGPCATRAFEGTRFVVCTYNSARQNLRLVSRGRGGGYLRGFAALQRALGADARRVRFAMNAGMYNDAGAPIGLYVEDNDEQHKLQLSDGPGNFHMKPNGVFSEDAAGVLRVETSEAFAARAASPRWATQSGPMLVIDGSLHPAFDADGRSRLVRNGVGVRDAQTALFVISEDPVSFGRFARFFREELACADALFLDGVVSSLWSPASARMDAHVPIGPMLVVLDD